MKELNLEKLQDNIEEVLSSNISFYRNSPDDESLYCMPPEIITCLGVEIFQYAATFFGALPGAIAAGRWITAKMKKKPTALSHEKQAGRKDKESLRSRLAVVRLNLEDDKLKTEFKKDIGVLLAYHGWPADEANDDAEKLLKIFIDERVN
ncbi:hypothetical protein DMA11_05930 [Marinilabiliaceae bacterium JC017]|nr:hypothetical protein DMA11_05930 [Marinilabiliaceae bacterium JC017]